MTKSNRFRRIMAGLMIACALVMGGCSAQPENGSAPQTQAAQPTDAPKILEKDTRSAQYFDTAVVITLYDAPEGLMDDMMAACAFYENLLSRTVVGSDVDRINKAHFAVANVKLGERPDGHRASRNVGNPRPRQGDQPRNRRRVLHHHRADFHHVGFYRRHDAHADRRGANRCAPPHQ